MTISLSDAGKRFNRDWIFRHFQHQFESGKSYAITGPNGSGKSTLLQVISGALGLNEGKIHYTHGAGSPISSEDVYQQVSICAPYLELVEEMTLAEFFSFHAHFKPFRPGISIKQAISSVNLETATHKQIRNFSSGMKQRAKLAQAIFSDVPVILLDEPCTNLDADGVGLYHRLIREYGSDRLVIVSSNDKVEYDFCQEVISISAFK